MNCRQVDCVLNRPHAATDDHSECPAGIRVLASHVVMSVCWLSQWTARQSSGIAAVLLPPFLLVAVWCMGPQNNARLCQQASCANRFASPGQGLPGRALNVSLGIPLWLHLYRPCLVVILVSVQF
jgi:hypothetical protein